MNFSDLAMLHGDFDVDKMHYLIDNYKGIGLFEQSYGIYYGWNN